jgi:hypothetical protein
MKQMALAIKGLLRFELLSIHVAYKSLRTAHACSVVT